LNPGQFGTTAVVPKYRNTSIPVPMYSGQFDTGAEMPSRNNNSGDSSKDDQHLSLLPDDLAACRV